MVAPEGADFVAIVAGWKYVDPTVAPVHLKPGRRRVRLGRHIRAALVFFAWHRFRGDIDRGEWRIRTDLPIGPLASLAICTALYIGS
jgi:hypothetical protein